MAFATLALTAISTVVGVVGALSSASAQAKQAEYQAAVARNNQTIAEQNKQYAVQAGESQAQVQGFKNRATLGAIDAAQGASGLDVSSPTLETVREGAGQVLRLDTENITQQALLRARNYDIQGMNYGAEAGLQTQAASNARTAGWFNAAGSLLGGSSSFAEKWTKYSSAGSSMSSTGSLY